MTQTITLAIVALCFFCGCSSVTNSMRVSEKNSIWNPVESVAKKRQPLGGEVLPPETMAAIWNFGVYEKPGTQSVRGLGGRIYFYDTNNNAVTADGELIVYGFDEEGDSTHPDKKFVFRASEFQSHYSESALGGSYSVWIPWDKVGGYRKSVTLLPVFKTKEGKIIRSEQSINLLAGKIRKAESVDSKHPYRVLGSSSAVLGKPSDKSNAKSNIAQASFDQTEGEGGAASGEYSHKIRTTSISLTPNLRRQVELGAQVRDGKKPYPVVSTASTLPSGATTTSNATRILATVDSSDQSSATEPVTRTSTSKGVFGSPGTFR